MDRMRRPPLQMEIENNQSLVHPGDSANRASFIPDTETDQPQWQTGALNQAFPIRLFISAGTPTYFPHLRTMTGVPSWMFMVRWDTRCYFTFNWHRFGRTCLRWDPAGSKTMVTISFCVKQCALRRGRESSRQASRGLWSSR
jgi:hypothetical protein